MRVDDHADGGNIDAAIRRSFDAPAARVFDAWLQPDMLSEWFAPAGFSVTLAETTPVAGGSWQVELRSEAGEVYHEYGRYREIARPSRIALTFTQAHGADVEPCMDVTVDLRETGGRTEMSFRQEGFRTTERRDGTLQGWQECFDKLEARLAAG